MTYGVLQSSPKLAKEQLGGVSSTKGRPGFAGIAEAQRSTELFLRAFRRRYLAPELPRSSLNRANLDEKGAARSERSMLSAQFDLVSARCRRNSSR